MSKTHAKNLTRFSCESVKMRMIVILMILIMTILMTSCSKQLDEKIVSVVSDACVCDVNKCECQDAYTGDLFVLDCTDVEVSSISSVMKNCQYSCIIDGVDWCEK